MLFRSTGKTPSQLVEELPKFIMIKDKMALSKEALDRSIDRLKDALGADSVSMQDGVRLAWSDCWILLRGSNTEPLVRLIAEGKDVETVQGLIGRAKEAIRGL